MAEDMLEGDLAASVGQRQQKGPNLLVEWVSLGQGACLQGSDRTLVVCASRTLFFLHLLRLSRCSPWRMAVSSHRYLHAMGPHLARAVRGGRRIDVRPADQALNIAVAAAVEWAVYPCLCVELAQGGEGCLGVV